MKKYDLEVLDRYSFGLIRSHGHGKWCPNFSISNVSNVIAKYLDEIYYTLSWNKVYKSFPLKVDVSVKQFNSCNNEFGIETQEMSWFLKYDMTQKINREHTLCVYN